MKTKQPEPATEKKEVILRAAMELITERGIHNAPMSLIARQAGVAAGTIYLYFESKEALVNELYLSLKAKMGDCFNEVLVQDLPYFEKLHLLWHNLFAYYTSHPMEFAFMEQFASGPAIPESVRKQGEQYYLPAVQLIMEGQKAGLLRDIPIALLMKILYANVATAVQMQLDSKEPLGPDFTDIMLLACLDGVRQT